MRRFRFSIASLLGVVLFISVALAALRASTDFWDGCLLGLDLAVLLTAILLVVHRTNPKRAYWLGVARFGWVYLIASLVPPVESRLPTTKGLDYLEASRSTVIPQGIVEADLDNDGRVDLLVAGSSAPDAVYLNNGDGTFRLPTSTNVGPGGNPTPNFVLWRRLMGTGGTHENFVRIGHSLLAIVMALIGGRLSWTLYAKDHTGMACGVDHPPGNGRRP